MFTIEMDFDEVLITLLDPEGKEEDVAVMIFDDIVYIRQWCDDLNKFSVIAMTPSQFQQLQHAYQLPEGVYVIENKRSEI